MSKFIHYYVSGKLSPISLSVFQGFGEPDWVPSSRAKAYLRNDYIHIITGLQFGSLEIYKQVINSGAPYVFIDSGYLNAKPNPDDPETWQFRVVLSAYQQNWVNLRNAERLQQLIRSGFKLLDWKPQDKSSYILLIPPSSPGVTELFSLRYWEVDTQNEIRKWTNRPVVVRRKGSEIPLATALAGAHCVITATSNVAVDAIVAGIPAFCSSLSAAAPVGNNIDHLHLIEQPRRPDRWDWLKSLAWGQFSIKEIQSGYAKEVLFD